jgi:hypothetical protein
VEALECSLEQVTSKAKKEKQKVAELEKANADLLKQAEVSAASLRDEKKRNEELLVRSRSLLSR